MDNDGIFNGSDEYAAKAAGNERKVSQEYLRLQIPKLNTPIITTVDFCGFRVLATSKLPKLNISYNEDGEIRKMGDELLHGVINQGDTFVNKSKLVQALLKSAATSLNLSEHSVKGLKDIASTMTYASSEIKVYRNIDEDNYYMEDFWTGMPSEVPSEVLHLPETQRGQSIFWRQMRPEFVRHYHDHLPTDACSSLSSGMPEYQENYEKVRIATRFLIQEIIPNYMEKLSVRKFRVPLCDGLGLSISDEFHSVGINIRHLGYMRSLLWRKLSCMGRVSHHDKSVKTLKDMRQEVALGEKLKVCNQLFEIAESKKYKLTAGQIRLSTFYEGESMNGLEVFVGSLKTDENSHELRLVFLGEMVARSVKSMIRLQMRAYSNKYKCSSTQYFRSLVCEYLNIISGGSPVADDVYQQSIYDNVRLRFGVLSIRPSEKLTLQRYLQPVIPFMISRLISMLGLRLSILCKCEFYERPVGFVFVSIDIMDVNPVIKHNIPILPFAEAQLANIKAIEYEKFTYFNQILLDKPSIFFTFSDRKGTRKAENKGYLGDNYGGDITRGCELEHNGPIFSDRFIRSFSFRPNAKSYVDLKHHTAIAPSKITQHFSVEIYFKCTGGKDSMRYIVSSGRYALVVTRDSYLSWIFKEGRHDINIKISPIVYNEWTHFVFTFDGITMRCYVNSVLTAAVEKQEILNLKISIFEKRIFDMKTQFSSDEDQEKSVLHNKVVNEAAAFFNTKEGVSTMKRLIEYWILPHCLGIEYLLFVHMYNKCFINIDYF